MKFHELQAWVAKATTQGLDPYHEIILAKDSEGNSFSPLASLSFGDYQADSTWSGDFVSKENFEGEGFKVNALCLWPTN
jgi:hypothetical protein